MDKFEKTWEGLTRDKIVGEKLAANLNRKSTKRHTDASNDNLTQELAVMAIAKCSTAKKLEQISKRLFQSDANKLKYIHNVVSFTKK